MRQDDIAFAERLMLIGIVALFSLVILAGVIENCLPNHPRSEAVMEAL